MGDHQIPSVVENVANIALIVMLAKPGTLGRQKIARSGSMAFCCESISDNP
jgi:uncharacterized protein